MGEGYAVAMYDTSFKHMMMDPEVMKVFLRLFVPELEGQAITDVRYNTTFVPPVPEPGKRKAQVDRDLCVTVNHVLHVTFEMQRRRHVMFDERGLFYAAGTYVNQLPLTFFEGDVPWYEHLKPVVAIHLLDHDTQRATGVEASAPDTLPAPCYTKTFGSPARSQASNWTTCKSARSSSRAPIVCVDCGRRSAIGQRMSGFSVF
jgi:hypothetical protein